MLITLSYRAMFMNKPVHEGTDLAWQQNSGDLVALGMQHDQHTRQGISGEDPSRVQSG